MKGETILIFSFENNINTSLNKDDNINDKS